MMSGNNYRRTGLSAPVTTETIGLEQSVSTQLNSALEILADEKRRHILYQFLDRETDVLSENDLVVALLSNFAADRATESELRCNLTHTQLPLLEAAGVIEYDRRQGTVRYNRLPALEEWLEHARHKETQ